MHSEVLHHSYSTPLLPKALIWAPESTTSRKNLSSTTTTERREESTDAEILD